MKANVAISISKQEECNEAQTRLILNKDPSDPLTNYVLYEERENRVVVFGEKTDDNKICLQSLLHEGIE